MQSRYSHARQMKRAKKCTNKLKTYLGRVIRDIERKYNKNNNTSREIQKLLAVSNRLCNQKKTDKNKIYSIHELSVSCIQIKGKRAKSTLNMEYMKINK